MKNTLFSLSILALLFSCGAETEEIRLQDKTFSNPLTASFTAAGTSFDPIVRGVTLISYPNLDEIKDFDFQVNFETYEKVFTNPTYSQLSLSGDYLILSEKSLIDYGSRMVNGISRSLSPEQKIQALVSQIINVGDVRDKAYEAYIKNEETLATKRMQVNLVEGRFESEINFYRIKKTPTGLEKYKKMYTLSKVEGFTYAKKKYNAKSCSQFLAKRYPKVAISLTSPEEAELLVGQRDDCVALGTVKDELESADVAQGKLIFDGISIPNTSVFYMGKSYITEILDELERVSGKDFLFTGISKESVLDQTFSKDQARDAITTIKFNKDITGYKIFSLVLELTSEGPRVYSRANGLIKNLRIVQIRPGVKVTMFDIVGGEINVSLELGMTSMRRFGARLIGDAFFTFKDGTKNRGVMKIEIDSLKDMNFPFSL